MGRLIAGTQVLPIAVVYFRKRDGRLDCLTVDYCVCIVAQPYESYVRQQQLADGEKCILGAMFGRSWGAPLILAANFEPFTQTFNLKTLYPEVVLLHPEPSSGAIQQTTFSTRRKSQSSGMVE